MRVQGERKVERIRCGDRGKLLREKRDRLVSERGREGKIR